MECIGSDVDSTLDQSTTTLGYPRVQPPPIYHTTNQWNTRVHLDSTSIDLLQDHSMEHRIVRGLDFGKILQEDNLMGCRGVAKLSFKYHQFTSRIISEIQ